jgi:hypothetical protein
MAVADVIFEGWAIVELMGHRQRGGYVKDVEMFGGKLLRVDIPVNAGTTVTEFYGCAALYALRPCTEEIVRDHVKNSYDGDLRPVRPVEYRDRERPEPPLLGSDLLEDKDPF